MYSSITCGAVTRIGNKHISRDIPCEDYSVAGESSGVTAVVVADGAGSKKYTHAKYGSESACKTVFDLLTEHFDELYNENRLAAVKSLIIAKLHVAFADIMKEMELTSIEQLSCTLLFCAVKDRRMLIGHLGDGLIVKVTPSGVSPVTMPQNEKDGSTYFITAGHAPDYLRLVKTTVDDCHAIALMTDGVQDSVYDETSGLVKPVVAKLCETFAKGRLEGEKAVDDTIAKYIVGGSNVSDDASLGIMYFDGTAAPDANALPGTADSFPVTDASFRELQKSMVADVRKAHEIIAGQASRAKDQEAGDDAVKAEDVSENIPEDKPSCEVNKEETVNDAKTKSLDLPSKSNARLVASLVTCGIEFVIIIVLLIMLIK